jgi:hypothetical protein
MMRNQRGEKEAADREEEEDVTSLVTESNAFSRPSLTPAGCLMLLFSASCSLYGGDHSVVRRKEE